VCVLGFKKVNLVENERIRLVWWRVGLDLAGAALDCAGGGRDGGREGVREAGREGGREGGR